MQALPTPGAVAANPQAFRDRSFKATRSPRRSAPSPRTRLRGLANSSKKYPPVLNERRDTLRNRVVSKLEMIFDCALSNSGAPGAQAMYDTARAADDLGFRALWASDHLLAPSSQ